MKTLDSLETISDGKLYDIKDMARVDTGGCKDCCDCCHGVGELVELTPYDVHEIVRGLQTSFEALLEEKLTLRDECGLLRPHLKMVGETEQCSFLDDSGRCGIHAYRPGICRLFPLGRVYSDNDFKYFLQLDVCSRPNLEKMKVKKWIGIDHYKENKAFILSWHYFMKALEFRMKFIKDTAERSAVNDYLLDLFYRERWEDALNFYEEFDQSLALAKEKLGIL
ncbi:MAG: YkgJ family cysteine cluster protein [Clostridia bacterium]|nr:YkgJ family cysteine cluster protein [Clostridia bacterium]